MSNILKESIAALITGSDKEKAIELFKQYVVETGKDIHQKHINAKNCDKRVEKDNFHVCEDCIDYNVAENQRVVEKKLGESADDFKTLSGLGIKMLAMDGMLLPSEDSKAYVLIDMEDGGDVPCGVCGRVDETIYRTTLIDTRLKESWSMSTDETPVMLSDDGEVLYAIRQNDGKIELTITTDGESETVELDIVDDLEKLQDNVLAKAKEFFGDDVAAGIDSGDLELFAIRVIAHAPDEALMENGDNGSWKTEQDYDYLYYYTSRNDEDDLVKSGYVVGIYDDAEPEVELTSYNSEYDMYKTSKVELGDDADQLKDALLKAGKELFDADDFGLIDQAELLKFARKAVHFHSSDLNENDETTVSEWEIHHVEEDDDKVEHVLMIKKSKDDVALPDVMVAINKGSGVADIVSSFDGKGDSEFVMDLDDDELLDSLRGVIVDVAGDELTTDLTDELLQSFVDAVKNMDKETVTEEEDDDDDVDTIVMYGNGVNPFLFSISDNHIVIMNNEDDVTYIVNDGSLTFDDADVDPVTKVLEYSETADQVVGDDLDALFEKLGESDVVHVLISNPEMVDVDSEDFTSRIQDGMYVDTNGVSYEYIVHDVADVSYDKVTDALVPVDELVEDDSDDTNSDDSGEDSGDDEKELLLGKLNESSGEIIYTNSDNSVNLKLENDTVKGKIGEAEYEYSVDEDTVYGLRRDILSVAKESLDVDALAELRDGSKEFVMSVFEYVDSLEELKEEAYDLAHYKGTDELIAAAKKAGYSTKPDVVMDFRDGKRYTSAYLFKMTDADKKLFNFTNMKKGADAYRMITHASAVSGLAPVVAFNPSNDMVYYVANDTNEDDVNLVFDTKGTKAYSAWKY